MEAEKEPQANNNAWIQWTKQEVRLKKGVLVLLEERDYLVERVDTLLAMTSKMQTQMERMGGQASMMLMLMRDLMNQAQLANNTFTMVNEYFDCIKLVGHCI